MGNNSSTIQYEEINPTNFPLKEGKEIELKNGRKISYENYGNPNGNIIILLFSGLPGGRLFCHFNQTKLINTDIRIISLDRPGFGFSTPQINRTLLDWATDVEEFSEILNIQKFSIIGYSAGGPFALACLYKIPQKIVGAAIISSLCPPNVPNVTDKMPFIFKFAYWSSSHWKSLLKLAIKLTAKEYLKDPVKAGRSDFKRYSEIDYQTYCNNPEIEKLFLKSALEMYSRKQENNEWYEYTLFHKNWGFSIHDIQCENVTIYHGKLDVGTTIEMGEYLHQQIKNSKAIFSENKGHLFFFDIWDEVIETLKNQHLVHHNDNNNIILEMNAEKEKNEK